MGNKKEEQEERRKSKRKEGKESCRLIKARFDTHKDRENSDEHEQHRWWWQEEDGRRSFLSLSLSLSLFIPPSFFLSKKTRSFVNYMALRHGPIMVGKNYILLFVVSGRVIKK